MATEEIDDLVLQAPAAKRVRLEATPEMEVNFTNGTTAEVLRPNDPEQGAEKTLGSSTEGQAIMHVSEPEIEGSSSMKSNDHNLDAPKGEDNTSAPSTIEIPSQEVKTSSIPTADDPPLTHALEAMLSALDPISEAATKVASIPAAAPAQDLRENADSIMENDGTIQAPVSDEHQAEAEHPEWEVDSSPMESSSDDSSSEDNSSDESDDGDNAYKMLTLEEQARILMEGDGASDDEGGDKKSKGSGGPVRTKNEVPEEVIPKPDVLITPEMPIHELGTVEGIIENVVLIKAKTSGEYRVLDNESVLCLEDRNAFGVVSETIGRVQQPLYSVRFTNGEEIAAAGLKLGVMVFYSEQHSKYVFTQSLKAFKGSDASNLHDEEVGDEEIEFSDDEAEAEHKRRIKQKKSEKRGGKNQQNGGPRRSAHGHPLQQQYTPSRNDGEISYDDPDDDGPYTPLARPTGYADTVGRGEAPQEGTFMNRPLSSGQGGYNQNQGRDQAGGRARAERGRSRGRGRGQQDRRGGGTGFPPPFHGHPNGGYAPASQNPTAYQQHSYNQQPGFPPTPTSPPINFYNHQMQQQQYSPHQPLMPTWHQHPPPPSFPAQPYQQSYPNAAGGWPNMAQQPPLPGGAFLNPAFFGGVQTPNVSQWNHQNAQSQEGQQNSQGGGTGGNEPR